MVFALETIWRCTWAGVLHRLDKAQCNINKHAFIAIPVDSLLTILKHLSFVVGIILCLPFILCHLFTGLIFGLTL